MAINQQKFSELTSNVMIDPGSINSFNVNVQGVVFGPYKHAGWRADVGKGGNDRYVALYSGKGSAQFPDGMGLDTKDAKDLLDNIAGIYGADLWSDVQYLFWRGVGIYQNSGSKLIASTGAHNLAELIANIAERQVQDEFGEMVKQYRHPFFSSNILAEKHGKRHMRFLTDVWQNINDDTALGDLLAAGDNWSGGSTVGDNGIPAAAIPAARQILRIMHTNGLGRYLEAHFRGASTRKPD